MKPKITKEAPGMNKYDVSVVLIIVFALIFIAAIWIWFGYKNRQMESELVQLISLKR